MSSTCHPLHELDLDLEPLDLGTPSHRFTFGDTFSTVYLKTITAGVALLTTGAMGAVVPGQGSRWRSKPATTPPLPPEGTFQTFRLCQIFGTDTAGGSKADAPILRYR